MQLIKKVKNMKYFKSITAVSVNLVIMVLFLLFTQMGYEIADNQTFSLFIADGDYNIKFTNYFLCAFCGFIQSIIYPINAFVIVHLVFCFCAFTAITRVFLDKFNPAVAVSVTLFINGFFAVNHYETVSFTRAPALLCVAGFLCIIHYINREKWKCGTIIGGLFVLVGATYRFRIFEVALVMAVLFVVAKSVSAYFAKDKEKRKFADLFKIVFEPKRLTACIVTVVICFSVNYISSVINTSTDELSYFGEYTAARSAVWDYAIPDYDVCAEEYDAIGIDENDVAMLRCGYMDDEGAFTLDKLYQIKEIQQKYNSETKSSLNIIKEMVVSEIANIRGFGDKGIASVSFVMVLFVFVLICKKRNLFIPIVLSAGVFVFYSYLWITSKVPFRAVYVLWFSGVIYLFYSFDFGELRKRVQNLYKAKRKMCIALCSVLLILGGLVGLYASRLGNDSLVNNYVEDSEKGIQNYIESNSDKKYEISRKVSLSLAERDVFTVKDKDIKSNCENFNCTYYRHPNYTKEVEAFGTDNMYSNLLNDNVYFVDNSQSQHIDMMKNYLEKYYSNGKQVEYEEIDIVDDNVIYKLFLK